MRYYRAPASDVTITKKWAWLADFVWQKSMEVYGKPLTTATSVVAKLPSVRLVLKKLTTPLPGRHWQRQDCRNNWSRFPIDFNAILPHVCHTFYRPRPHLCTCRRPMRKCSILTGVCGGFRSEILLQKGREEVKKGNQMSKYHKIAKQKAFRTPTPAP